AVQELGLGTRARARLHRPPRSSDAHRATARSREVSRDDCVGLPAQITRLAGRDEPPREVPLVPRLLGVPVIAVALLVELAEVLPVKGLAIPRHGEVG